MIGNKKRAAGAALFMFSLTFGVHHHHHRHVRPRRPDFLREVPAVAASVWAEVPASSAAASVLEAAAVQQRVWAEASAEAPAGASVAAVGWARAEGTAAMWAEAGSLVSV